MNLPTHPIFKTAAGCAALLLFFVQGASAQIVTETFTYTTPTQDMPISDLFSLPDFDTSLGTLQGIDLTFSTSATADIVVFNSTNKSANFTNASVTLPTSLTGPGSAVINATLSASLASGIATPGFNSYSGLTDSATESKTISSGDFSLWEDQSGDKVNLTYTTGNGSYSGTGPLNTLFFGGSATGGQTTTVTYTYLKSTYQATPEPSQMALFGIALGAFALLLIRRNAIRDL